MLFSFWLFSAQYIPPEKVHAKMFPKYWITPESVLGRKKNLKSKQNGRITQENKDKHRKRLTTKLNRAVNVLKEMGIDYFPQIYDPEMKKTATPETTVPETAVQAAVSEEEADEIPQLVAVPTPEPVAKTPENASKKRRQSMKKTPAKSATPTTKTPSSTPKKRITRAAAAAIAAATGTPKASPSVGLKKDTMNVSVGKKRIV